MRYFSDEVWKSSSDITKGNNIGLRSLAHINPVYFSINPKMAIRKNTTIHTIVVDAVL